MLSEKRVAYIFTANTPHVAHANLMLDSLFDKNRGSFRGDCWVISTGLSNRAKNYLDSRSIKYLVCELTEWNSWHGRVEIAKSQPEYHELSKNHSESKAIDLSYELYRNKRMSKLIFLEWFKKFGDKYDFIALGDNDLYFQKPIMELYEYAYKDNPEKIWYWHEENEILPGTNLWKKDFHYKVMHDSVDLEFGFHEINIGFIMGTPRNMNTLFSKVKELFSLCDISMFTKYSWHDQDLVRLIRAKYPERFSLFPEGSIIHLCNGGEKTIEEKAPGKFFYKALDQKPYLIHFAGGAWKKYPSIKSTYEVDPDCYYFEYECGKEYDVIRKGAPVTLFDICSDEYKYYTEKNKQTKEAARSKWRKLYNNGKNKILFIGWLETGTHKSTLNAIPEFFHSDIYDLAVLNGNVTNSELNISICEEFPQIIAQLTRITKDPYLIRTYGYDYDNIPMSVIGDTIKSAMYEYDCSSRTALAIANILYMYFSEAISYYSPDVVVVWGMFSPWGKLIQNYCKEKKQPCCSLEWGILPGTVQFDYCGHMGESWVSRESKFFNNLFISEKDIQNAKEYLSIAAKSSLSRNNHTEIELLAKNSIKRLRTEGKKIILYVESNSAHSGNTFCDEKRSRLHAPFFRDDCEAYHELQKLCCKHTDWHIVYKPHPISKTRGLRTDINDVNTTILWDGDISECMQLADLSITILSQSAYISLINNIPVVLLGTIQLTGSRAAYTLSDKAEFENVIENALCAGMTEAKREAFVEHVARCLKYYVYSADPEISKYTRNGNDLAKDFNGLIEGKYADNLKYDWEAYESNKKEASVIDTENPKVSIIIPIYNSEEYLSNCLDSLLNQTLISLEILCVNNGSTDASADILDYYSSRDKRVVVHNQSEPNQRIARNWGINNAKGKYIYLMDSDDVLEATALKELVESAESTNSDVLYFFFKELRADRESSRPRPRFYSYKRFMPSSNIFALKKEYYKFFIQYPFPWAKLILREFALSNNLYFDVGCSNFDDNPHNLRTLLSAKNPHVLNKQFYNFRIHEKSMTQSTNPRILGMIDAVRIMNEIYQENGVYDVYQRWFVPYKVHLIGWAWNFLPEDLKEQYFDSARKLFLPGDERFLIDDECWSYYEMPDKNYVTFVRSILSETYESYQEKEAKVTPDKRNGGFYTFKNVLRKMGLLSYAVRVRDFLGVKPIQG